MALSLDELVKKYTAGTMTDADLKESGFMMHQVEYRAKGEMADSNLGRRNSHKEKRLDKIDEFGRIGPH